MRKSICDEQLHHVTEKYKEGMNLLSEHCPSWLYSVHKGATTVREHWDGIKENGGFWSPTINSFNHYAYGAVFDWIFKNVAGIDICEDGAGYRHIRISSIPDKRLGFANIELLTKYGKLNVSWRYHGDTVSYDITVPDGITAEVCLPDSDDNLQGYKIPEIR